MPRDKMDDAAAARIKKARGEQVCLPVQESRRVACRWGPPPGGGGGVRSLMLKSPQDPFAQRASNAAKANKEKSGKEGESSSGGGFGGGVKAGGSTKK